MKLKEYMIKHQLVPESLAEQCSCSVASLYRYFKGKSPSLKNAYHIEKATNKEVTVEDLLDH